MYRRVRRDQGEEFDGASIFAGNDTNPRVGLTRAVGSVLGRKNQLEDKAVELSLGGENGKQRHQVSKLKNVRLDIDAIDDLNRLAFAGRTKIDATTVDSLVQLYKNVRPQSRTH